VADHHAGYSGQRIGDAGNLLWEGLVMAVTEYWNGDVREVLLHPYEPLTSLLDMIDPDERWPLYVYYDARGARMIPRDHFYLGPSVKRPSDCVWIVPGSTP
jgi:hypothetical protein